VITPDVTMPDLSSSPKGLKATAGMTEGLIIHRVQPEYPAAAMARRIQGDVVLGVTISRDGSVTNLRVMSGHPSLVAAAVQAARQWKYRPYVINGEAVEVETIITIRFHL